MIVLIAVAVLALAAPAARAQDAVERAADALRTDHVYVDPSAERAITEEEADELRRRIGARAVYIAILPSAAGSPAEAVAESVARQVGRSGTYAVIVGDSFRAGGTPDAAEAAEQAFDEHSGEGVATVLGDFVGRVSGEGGDPGGDGGGAGGLILLGLAGAGGAALIVSRRRRRRREEAEFAEVKDNARDDLIALGEDIRALDLDMEMPDAPADAREHYAHAVAAYERADAAWERARTPEQLEPVGAALEEGRWEMVAARARLEHRDPPERRTPCFFDPRHGPSDRDVKWAPEYGEPRMVPACEADAQRVERGEDPQSREVLVGGERMPYWAAGPMYAPFMGGFFGVGLLPGLMMGTMLGSMWDAPADVGGGDFGGFGGGDFGGGDFGGGGDF